ncbi:MAG: hypothetical protein J7M39_12680 [Anaerolineae bacterium]|nr:hypothetical protein [Anaerolineae bacterium]
MAWAEKLGKMTYGEALARIPDRAAPDFWVGDLKGIDCGVERMTRGRVQTIATSPGGRPVYLLTYGERQAWQRLANYNSAIGAREPAAFLAGDARSRPVVAFIGPVHAHETEGLTGLMNLVAVMETGHDLRGRARAALRALADQCRLLIVPCGNPDGLARFEPRLLNGMGLDDLRFWGQGTWADDTLCGWPGCKRLHPMRGDAVGFLGCYFNDAGINPMHDEFFAPMSDEVAAILLLVREEAPDLAVSLHSHENPPALLRPAYVPLEIQRSVSEVAAQTYVRFDAQGVCHGLPFEPSAERGPHPAPFNLTSAIHHTSGATAFTFECPHGTCGDTAYAVTPERILDIQLALYESMLVCALS